MNEQEQKIVDALPASGEVPYETLQKTLMTSGNYDAIEAFHPMRRAGKIAATVKNVDGETVLFVSRVPTA